MGRLRRRTGHRRRGDDAPGGQCAGTCLIPNCLLPGSTLSRPYPEPIGPPLHPATRQPPALMTWPPFPDGADRPGGRPPTEPRWTSPERSSTSSRFCRPTPLVRATRLEQRLGTPARIYDKDESVSGRPVRTSLIPPSWINVDNKANGASPGSRPRPGPANRAAPSPSPAPFHGLECQVYMVRASYEQKPYRRLLMETWGGNVVRARWTSRSPRLGSAPPSATPCATPSAALTAITRPGRRLNHVLLHQTVIGQEAKAQLALAGEERPDVVIGCCGQA